MESLQIKSMDKFGGLLSTMLISLSALPWLDILPTILQIVSLLIGIAVGITWLILNRQKYLIQKKRLDE